MTGVIRCEISADTHLTLCRFECCRVWYFSSKKDGTGLEEVVLFMV